jgi:hypothetical protein
MSALSKATVTRRAAPSSQAVCQAALVPHSKLAGAAPRISATFVRSSNTCWDGATGAQVAVPAVNGLGSAVEPDRR